MCGRYKSADARAIEKIIREFTGDFDFDVKPRYNVAPGQLNLIIMNGTPPTAAKAHWGLVPFWAKDSKVGYSMINAKSETLKEKPAYRNLIKTRRCLIPADGFYEWRVDAPKIKTPIHFHLRSHDAFCFAGLWDRWMDKATGEELTSYTVITSEPNELVKPVHDRMPVMLHHQDFRGWLDGGDLELLKPYPASEMESSEVSRLVNSVKNDSPDCLTLNFPPVKESGGGAKAGWELQGD